MRRTPSQLVSARRLSLALLLASLPVLLCQPVSGQQSVAESRQDNASTVEDEILVTATRSEESLETSSASVTVFDTADLESSPALVVDEVLRSAPGFSLFRRSSSLVAQPTTQGVSLRGIGPSGVSRTLVLLDGVPLNDPFGGWVTWSRVALADLERVEIVRGGGSNVWGSSALGGVIQLFTKQEPGFLVAAQAELGERSTTNADLSVSNRGDRWRGSAHLNLLDYGGYRQIRADQRGAIDIPTDSEHWQLDGRVGYAPSEGTLISARVEHLDEERSNGTPLTDNSLELDAVVVSAEMSNSDRGGWSLRGHWQDQEFAARFSAQAPDRSSEQLALDQFLVAADRVGGSLLRRQRFGSADGVVHSLVAGIDGRATEGATNERFFFSDGDFLRQRVAGGDEKLAGAFAQDTMDLAAGVELQVGLRWDRWESQDGLRREFNRSDGSVRLRQEFPDRSDDAISPRVGISIALGDSLRLKGAAYGAFRAPTINELYRPFRVGNDITAANAELVPEELRGAELGLAGAMIVGRGLRWSATAFYNELEDPIANVTIGSGPGVVAPCGFTPGGGSCRQRQNLDRTVVRGAEAQMHLQRTRWSVDLGYQYSDAEVDRAPNAPDLVGRQLAQVPKNSASIRIDGALAQRWFGEVGVRYASRQFEDDLNQRPLDSYVLAHLGTRFELTQALTLFVRAENLFDEEVEVGRSGSGLFTIGAPRLVRGGVRWRLRR